MASHFQRPTCSPANCQCFKLSRLLVGQGLRPHHNPLNACTKMVLFGSGLSSRAPANPILVEYVYPPPPLLPAPVYISPPQFTLCLEGGGGGHCLFEGSYPLTNYHLDFLGRWPPAWFCSANALSEGCKYSVADSEGAVEACSPPFLLEK